MEVVLIINLGKLIGNLINAPRTEFDVQSLLSTLEQAEAFKDLEGSILFDQEILCKLYWGEPITFPTFEKIKEDILKMPSIVDNTDFI